MDRTRFMKEIQVVKEKKNLPRPSFIDFGLGFDLTKDLNRKNVDPEVAIRCMRVTSEKSWRLNRKLSIIVNCLFENERKMIIVSDPKTKKRRKCKIPTRRRRVDKNRFQKLYDLRKYRETFFFKTKQYYQTNPSNQKKMEKRFWKGIDTVERRIFKKITQSDRIKRKRDIQYQNSLNYKRLSFLMIFFSRMKVFKTIIQKVKAKNAIEEQKENFSVVVFQRFLPLLRKIRRNRWRRSFTNFRNHFVFFRLWTNIKKKKKGIFMIKEFVFAYSRTKVFILYLNKLIAGIQMIQNRVKFSRICHQSKVMVMALNWTIKECELVIHNFGFIEKFFDYAEKRVRNESKDSSSCQLMNIVEFSFTYLLTTTSYKLNVIRKQMRIYQHTKLQKKYLDLQSHTFFTDEKIMELLKTGFINLKTKEIRIRNDFIVNLMNNEFDDYDVNGMQKEENIKMKFIKEIKAVFKSLQIEYNFDLNKSFSALNKYFGYSIMKRYKTLIEKVKCKINQIIQNRFENYQIYIK